MSDDHFSFVDHTNLKDLQLSCCKITDLGVSYIRGKQYDMFLFLFGGWSFLLWMYCCLLWALFSFLMYIDIYWPVFNCAVSWSKVWQVCSFFPVGLQKLTHLNLEGCPVTASCLEAISGLASFSDSILCCAYESWYYVTSVKVSYLFLWFSWFISVRSSTSVAFLWNDNVLTCYDFLTFSLIRCHKLFCNLHATQTLDSCEAALWNLYIIKRSVIR
jgi:hypothetical protein